jgi:hypothetical protein
VFGTTVRESVVRAAAILCEMFAPSSDRINYWNSVAKREEKFIIAAL